jgi:hypothetical protein
MLLLRAKREFLLMSTPAQIAANQANAKLPCGPEESFGSLSPAEKAKVLEEVNQRLGKPGVK